MDISKRGKIKIIGIAGGLGSGKSTITEYLINKGYRVFDADEIARDAVMPGEPALKELIEYFGKDILNDDGTLNRRMLARLTFDNINKTKKLNSILHKDITRRLDTMITDHITNIKKEKSNNMGASISVFISAPLFFEADLEKKCDLVWAVTAKKEIRIKRALLRDDLPRKEIEDRISRQMTDEERIKLADRVIPNNGTKKELICKVEELLNTL